jgi:hypothetical protein
MLTQLPTCLVLCVYDHWLEPDARWAVHQATAGQTTLLDWLCTQARAVVPAASLQVWRDWASFDRARIAVTAIPWTAVAGGARWLVSHATTVVVHMSDLAETPLNAEEPESLLPPTLTSMSVWVNLSPPHPRVFPTYPLSTIRDLHVDIGTLYPTFGSIELFYFPFLETLRFTRTRDFQCHGHQSRWSWLGILRWPSAPPPHLRRIEWTLYFPFLIPYAIPTVTHVMLHADSQEQYTCIFQLFRTFPRLQHLRTEGQPRPLRSLGVATASTQLHSYHGWCRGFLDICPYAPCLQEIDLYVDHTRCTPTHLVYPATLRRLTFHADVDHALVPWLQRPHTPATVWIVSPEGGDRSEYATRELLAWILS